MEAEQNALARVDEQLISQIKQEIWRTSTAEDTDALALEQTQVVRTVMGKLDALIQETVAKARTAPQPPASVLGSLPEGALDSLIAPHLPLLMLRGYPAVAREALAGVRTQTQQAALLTLTQYMSGVYEEMSDKLGDLQWQQLQKLRELCDAAAEGGTEQVMETAVLMKEELDTDFCNYMNYAIEQEEQRLRGEGLEPVVGPRLAAAEDAEDGPMAAQPPPAAEGAAQPQPAAGGAVALGAAGAQSAATAPVEKLAHPELAEQRWLMVLRLVRQGVYALLAKDYQDDIKWVRYIIGLASPEARSELATRVFSEMNAEQRAKFLNTVTRISDNLSVQRDARDLEIFNKVQEVRAVIEGFDRGYSEYGATQV